MLVFRRDNTPASGAFYRLSLKRTKYLEVEPVRLTSTLYTGKATWVPKMGGPAFKVVDGVLLGNFDVVEDGLYYIDHVSGDAGSFSDRPSGETRLRYYDCATSRSATVATTLGTVGLGMSATRDGRTVFFARIDPSMDELILVDDFR